MDPVEDCRVFRGAWERLRGCQCSEPRNLSDQRPSYRLGTSCPCPESSGLRPTLGPGVSAPKVGLSLVPSLASWGPGERRGGGTGQESVVQQRVTECRRVTGDGP